MTALIVKCGTILIGATLCSGGPNTLCWIYPNELFPTEDAASMDVILEIGSGGDAVSKELDRYIKLHSKF